MSWLRNGSFEEGSLGWTGTTTVPGDSVSFGAPSSGPTYHGDNVACLRIADGGDVGIESDLFSAPQNVSFLFEFYTRWRVVPPDVATLNTQIGTRFLVWNLQLLPGEWVDWGTFQTQRDDDEYRLFTTAAGFPPATFLKFAPGGGRVGLQFFDDDAETGDREMFVDAVKVRRYTGADMAKFEALDAVRTALEGIVGSPGYHTDLGSRVYTRELWPAHNPGVPRPYLYLVEDPATFAPSQRVADETLRLAIVGVVEATDSDDVDSSTFQAISQMHDDIVKALWADQTFGGTVNEFTIDAIDTPPPLDKWQAIEVRVSLRVIYDPSTLGP